MAETAKETMDRIVAQAREIGAANERIRIARMLRERGELQLAIEVLTEPETALPQINA